MPSLKLQKCRNYALFLNLQRHKNQHTPSEIHNYSMNPPSKCNDTEILHPISNCNATDNLHSTTDRRNSASSLNLERCGNSGLGEVKQDLHCRAWNNGRTSDNILAYFKLDFLIIKWFCITTIQSNTLKNLVKLRTRAISPEEFHADWGDTGIYRARYAGSGVTLANFQI